MNQAEMRGQAHIAHGGGGRGILDQDVIHYDAWIRKHSYYAFTRLSARGLTQSALEKQSNTGNLRRPSLKSAIFIVIGSYINHFDRNVEIKSSAGSFPSSLVHFKHLQDWVIRGYTIEFVTRIRTGNPFRCAVTDHSYSATPKYYQDRRGLEQEEVEALLFEWDIASIALVFQC